MMPKSLTIWFLTGVWILCEYQIQANNRYVYESDTDLDVAAPGLALRDGQHQQHEHHLRHHRQSSKTMWSILDQTVKSNEIADNKRQKELQQHQQQHMQHKKERKVQSNCPKCKNELRINEQELTELRIAYVKKQILKKLKLKERPQVSVSHIPRPVAEGATIQLDDSDDIQSRVSEEFYARTTQKIIFPQLDSEQCKLIGDDLGSSMCFTLQIPADIDYRDVESAELWVYKQPHIMNANKHSFVVNEIEHWDTKSLMKPFAIQDTNVTEDWVKIDIAWRIQNWIKYNDLYHVIGITCNTCEKHPSLDLFSLDNDYKPFIVVNTHPSRKIKRQRRSINCSPGVTECCREKLYISFEEIGWNNWILHPPGYDAYFCRGACDTAASITLSGSHHNSVLMKVMYQRNNTKSNSNSNSNSKSLELVPCCTATQYSSLQLFYMDSNNTATQKTLPNMVVEACGCM